MPLFAANTDTLKSNTSTVSLNFYGILKKMSGGRHAEGRGVLGALKAHKLCSKESLLAHSFFSLLSLPYQ